MVPISSPIRPVKRLPGKRKKTQRLIASSLDALLTMRKGFGQLTAALACTLGPNQGPIVNARTGVGAPEFLTESGIIARRISSFTDPVENIGLQICREMVLTLHDKVGDGAATAAVLALAIVDESLKQISAGINPMRLQSGLEQAARLTIDMLKTLAQPIEGQQALSRLAGSVTNNPDLGYILGELFDMLGPGAAISIEKYYTPYLDREYIDGGRWTGRPAGRDFLTGGSLEASFEHPLILIADETLETIEHIQPALELALQAQPRRPLVIIARDVKGEALNTLLLNAARGVLQTAAILPTANLFPMTEELNDLALVTGATKFSKDEGRLLKRLAGSDFGHARRVTFSRDRFTVVGGGGAPAALQQQVALLRTRMNTYHRMEANWEKYRLRAARLAGGVGILKIGAHHEKEVALLEAAAKKGVRMLDLALQDGIAPGGGVAYLACQPRLREAAAECRDEQQALGYRVLVAALEAPFCQIVKNSGELSPSVALETVRQLGHGYGLDVRSLSYTPMLAAGVLDCASVLTSALQAAASAAGALITTDKVIII